MGIHSDFMSSYAINEPFPFSWNYWNRSLYKHLRLELLLCMISLSDVLFPHNSHHKTCMASSLDSYNCDLMDSLFLPNRIYLWDISFDLRILHLCTWSTKLSLSWNFRKRLYDKIFYCFWNLNISYFPCFIDIQSRN